MLSMESPIETSAILELETEATSITAKSFWDVICGDSTRPVAESKNTKGFTKGDISGKSNKTGLNLATAILILLVALLLGWAFTVLGPVKPVH